MNNLIKINHRTITFFLAITVFSHLYAQPGIIGNGFSTGWNNPSDIRSLSPSFGQSYMIVLNPQLIGNPSFRWVKGTIEQSPSATCMLNEDRIINNADITVMSIGASNCTNSSWNIKSSSLTDNFIFKASNTNIDEFFVARIAGTIRTIETVSHSPADVPVGVDVVVTANLSGNLPVGQRVYLRYSRDNFATSSIIEMTTVGSTCNATIPANINSVGIIQYYVFTSGKGIPTSDASKADFYSININDNDGAYYSYTIGSGTTYTWVGNIDNDWQNALNWIPNRTTTNASDILIFNNGLNNTISNISSQSIGSLQVLNNTIVNLQASSNSSTLNINNGIQAYDFILETGSEIHVKGSNILKLGLNANATSSISGKITFSNAAHLLTAVSPNAIIFNSGALLIQDTGFTGELFTKKGAENIAIFMSGAQFIQKSGANPFGLTQPKSKVIFQEGSWYRFLANETPSLSGRTFANFEYNLGVSKNGVGSNIVFDTLLVSQGTFNINATGGVTIKKNITIASGATLTFTPSSAGIFNLTNTTSPALYNSGTLTIGPNATVNLNSDAEVSGVLTNNGTLNVLNGGISGTGRVNLNSSSYFSTNHSNGINGCITTSSKNFLNDVNYTFTGSNNQSGNILTNRAKSITLNKTAGNVSFSNDITIDSFLVFAINNLGLINMGSKTLILNNNSPSAINRLGEGHIIGKLQRAIATGNNTYNFPIGTTASYSPSSINFTSVSSTGTLVAQAVEGLHSQASSHLLSKTAYLNHWWQLTPNGLSFSNAAVQFTYPVNALTGGALSHFLKLAQYNGSTWNTPSVSTGTNSISSTTNTQLGDFVAANAIAPINDNSDNAIEITQNIAASCGSSTDGTLYASTAATINSNSCLNGAIDVWYRFIPKTPNPTITVNANTDIAIQLLESNASTGVTCANTSTGNSENLNATGLVAGSTYFIRIAPTSNVLMASDVTFSICVNGEMPSSVSTEGLGNCTTTRPIHIQGQNTNNWIPITDSNNNIVAAIKDENNDLGIVTTKLFNRTPSTLRTNNSLKFSDRDLEITPTRNQAATIRFYFTSSDLAALGGSLSAARILRIPNGTCSTSADFTGGTEIVPTAIGSNYVEFLTPGFSRFYLGSPASPLPVELASFEGYTEGGKNILTWKVTSQVNSEFFVLERSVNGLNNWSSINEPIQAAGTTNETLTYSLTDDFPIPTAYYRLKIIDTDRSVRYSKVISLVQSGLPKPPLKIYPNPVKDVLNIEYAAEKNGNIYLEIVDIFGRFYEKHSFISNKSMNLYRLDTSFLSKGIYFLKMEIEGEIYVEKFFKN